MIVQIILAVLGGLVIFTGLTLVSALKEIRDLQAFQAATQSWSLKIERDLYPQPKTSRPRPPGRVKRG